jgi:Asp-tRNA(Asn)/Glu-tRNA(Gln) amidotransferase A subunit family amidase
MGYSRGDSLPIGVTFYGRAWSEEKLIERSIAGRRHRRRRRGN